jgi:protein gp37
MWGVNGYRYETAGWERELRKLNRKAARRRTNHEGAVRKMTGEAIQHDKYVRPRVFINSLSDTFEDWRGPVYRLDGGEPVTWAHSLDDVRRRFFRVAEECTELDLLLLTKRPENVYNMVPNSWRCNWRPWVWIGTTVEDQAHADKRVPELLKVPARVRFLSVEPLLGKVDLLASFARAGKLVSSAHFREYLQWVIVGGESGTNARPMHPDWVRTIRDQCAAAGVPFFLKQWGEWAPLCRADMRGVIPDMGGKEGKVVDGWLMIKVGKKNAGRVLDGRTWDEVPT